MAPAPQEANASAAYNNAKGNPSPAAGPSETNKPSTAAKGTKTYIVGRRSELRSPPTLSAKKVVPPLPFRENLLLRRKLTKI
jgi:hypothetical protein